MHMLRDLPVARKFALAFGILFVVCASLGVIALAGLTKSNRSTTNLSDVVLPSSAALSDMTAALQVYRRADMGILLCADSACQEGYVQRRLAAVNKFHTAYNAYIAVDAGSGQRQLVDSSAETFSQYQRASDATVYDLLNGEKDKAASQTVGANALVFRRAESSLDSAAAANTENSRNLCLAAATTFRSVRTSIVVVIVFAMLLCLVVGRLLTQSIVPPLIHAERVLEAVAAKDLTQTIEAEGKDEIGRMATALNTAVSTMRSLLHSMQRGVETVSAAAAELSSHAQQSSANAERQCSETNQIASATQEMASTITEVSRNAERANSSSRQVAHTANEGGAAIGQTTERMREISEFTAQTVERMASLNQRSEQIGQVVTTIREISEQTNLLALNAAIEAQRAGEHGRGFAVVAGEVRRLAERTKSATEEISGTIATIQSETRQTLNLIESGRAGVEAGLAESQNAQHTLDSIIELARHSEDQIAMIATASTEEAAASQEISKSIGRICEISSTVTAAAGETRQASAELSSLAAELNREINSFVLADDAPGSRDFRGLPQRSGTPLSVTRAAAGTALLLALCAGPLISHTARAEESNPPAPAADAQATPPPRSQYQEMKRELDQASQLLREQSDAIRILRLELERQGKELESLRSVGASSAAAGPAAASAARDAALLQSATAALRAETAAPVATRLRAAQQDYPPMPPSDLFFRIGNVTFTPTGWVDFTSYWRSTDVGSGLGTNFATIPYNNTVQGDASEVRFTSQSSRIGMRVDENFDKVKAYGYLEADFNGYLPGNAYVSTNSNTLRMRVYYVNLARGKWEILAGQGWSLLTPTRKALSPFLADLFNTFHLDTNYQAGLTYARQTQFRFVYHPTNTIALGLSVENPEQYSGSAVTFPALFSTSETDINSSSGSGGATTTPNLHPDLIAKATFDRTINGLYWHVGVAGLLTSSRAVTPVTVTKTVENTDAREGGGIAFNSFLELFKGFHFLGFGYWSDGGGRYMGGLGPGFVALQPGTATSPFKVAQIHSDSAIGGFEWTVTPRNTISAYQSAGYFQRRFGLDPSVKTPTYIGYGFPGSANTNNRIIKETSFATISTLWQNPARGTVQVITQTSYVLRAPWYVALNSPKDAHTMMEFMALRYVIP